jgi:uncharacterized protein YjiK
MRDAGCAHDERLSLQVRDWHSRFDYRSYLRDLSSVEIHLPTGHLLLLSGESKVLVEYDPSGKLVEIMPLWRGHHGLKADVPHAEGVTFDESSVLYIVSEPNLFYRFERASAMP